LEKGGLLPRLRFKKKHEKESINEKKSTVSLPRRESQKDPDLDLGSQHGKKQNIIYREKPKSEKEQRKSRREKKEKVSKG